jgi:hypothetical protein
MKTPNVSKVYGAKIHCFGFAIGDLGKIHSVNSSPTFVNKPSVRATWPYSGDSDVESLPVVLIPNFWKYTLKLLFSRSLMDLTT